MKREEFITQILLGVGGYFAAPVFDKLGYKNGLFDQPFDKSLVPEPILEDHPEFKELYYKAWELAFAHIKSQDNIPQSPYMDEAFSASDIWIWDTCFMVQFCKYAPSVFPGIQSLRNFYEPLYDDVEMPLVIHILDNPPLFAWTEYEYFKMTNDKQHLKTLIEDKQYLQKHFNWFDTVKPGFTNAKSHPTFIERVDKGYHWEGGRSGMDNTPRGRTGKNATEQRPNNPKMLWIDAIAQQGLSALCISRLYHVLGDEKLGKEWRAKYTKIKDTVNEYYWDEEQGFYFDIDESTLRPYEIVTPASFWPMLAEMCTPEQAEKMISKIKDPNVLGGIVPWVTLARNDADFAENGNYWRGSMWLPTAYMGIKAIEKYNYHLLAHQNAYDIIKHMSKTYQNYSPHTIWECYNPNDALPATNEHAEGKIVRPDFCGWSALGPISLLIENVLGFYEIDANKNTVKWSKILKGKHGIKRLTFGKIITDIIADGDRISVSANEPFTLIVNDKKIKIKTGDQSFSLASLI